MIQAAGALLLTLASQICDPISCPSTTSAVSARDTGAVGDGVANDYCAVQKAIECAGVGSAYIPSGIYLLKDDDGWWRTLKVDGATRVFGNGKASRLVYWGSGPAMHINSGAGVMTDGVVVENIMLDGEHAGDYGIQVGNSTTSPLSAAGVIRNVRLERFKAAGAYLLNAQVFALEHIRARNNRGDGILIASGGANRAVAIRSCMLDGNWQAGLRIESVIQLSVTDCVMQLNSKEGVVATLGTPAGDFINAVSFRNTHIEANNLAALPTPHYEVSFTSQTTRTMDTVTFEVTKFASAGDKAMRLESGSYHVAYTYNATQPGDIAIGPNAFVDAQDMKPPFRSDGAHVWVASQDSELTYRHGANTYASKAGVTACVSGPCLW